MKKNTKNLTNTITVALVIILSLCMTLTNVTKTKAEAVTETETSVSTNMIPRGAGISLDLINMMAEIPTDTTEEAVTETVNTLEVENTVYLQLATVEDEEDIILDEIEGEVVQLETTEWTPSFTERIWEDESLTPDLQYRCWEMGKKYNVPKEIIMAIAYRESTYRPSLISADGHDYGLCQIRDVNHDRVNKAVGRKLDYLNGEDSIEACAFMLSELYQKYSANGWHYILMSYNGGEGYSRKLAKQGIYSSKYSRAVLEKAYSLGF